MHDNPVIRLSLTDHSHLTRLAFARGLSLAQTVRELSAPKP
jgi:hypothetical protein